MALKRISDLTAAGALTGAEELPIGQSGATVKTTVADVVALASGAVTSFNGRTGAVVATSGDYTSDEVTEGTANLYFTGARVATALAAGTGISLSTATGVTTITATGGGGGMTNPMTTAQDLIVGGASGAPARFPIITDGQVLGAVGGAWAGVPLSGGGDMLAATYDPAGIAEQVVGETAAQTLTNKDLTDATNTFPATLARDRSTVTPLTNSAGTVNIDWSLGDYFTLAMAANVTTITHSNLPASGKGRTICIDVSQNDTGGWTFAVPSGWKAIGNSDTAIQSAASAKTRIILSTLDGGTTYPYSMAKVAA